MARIPSSGRGAIVLVATVSLLISLVNWAISTILTALLVIALAKRKELNMDYRAARQLQSLVWGATWALELVHQQHSFRQIKPVYLSQFIT